MASQHLHTFTVRLVHEDFQRLNELATAGGLTMSEMLRRLIELTRDGDDMETLVRHARHYLDRALAPKQAKAQSGSTLPPNKG